MENEPDSLRVMLASLDRHFQEKGLPFSIRKYKPFEASRRTLNGKAIELREAGLGKRKNKADALIEEETLQESWEERAQQVSTTLCSMCSANSLGRGVVRSTTRCELKISNVSGTQRLVKLSI